MNASGLNLSGWVFIAAAWGMILTISIFCFKRVLGTHDKK